RVGTLLKSMAAEARAQLTDAEKAKLLLDADSAGPTKIHRFILAADKGALRQAHDVLGEAVLSLAFRPDAVVVGVGDGSESAIKMIAAPAAPGPAPLASVTLDVAQLAPLFAPTPKLRAAAAEIFRAPGDGVCQLRVSGGDKLTAQISIRT